MIVSDFVDSVEADDQIVVSDYTAFLHRQPEQGVTGTWVNMLEAPSMDQRRGWPWAILASPEFDQDAVSVQV